MHKTRGIQVAAYTAATFVMLCVAGMSWSGLYGWARQVLGWPELTAGAVPVSLDVAALTCALFALDTVSRDDPATAYRALTGIFVGLSAFVNWRYRLSSHNITEEVFFPVMSILAFLLIDTTVRKYRRDSRRKQAGERSRRKPRALTRFGLLAWVPGIGHPLRAWGATSAELAERIPAQNQNQDSAGSGTGREREPEPPAVLVPAPPARVPEPALVPEPAADENQNRDRGGSGTGGTTNREPEPGEGSVPEPAANAAPEPVTRNREPRRSPDETAAALVPEAKKIIAAWRAEHGKDPNTDELRSQLKVSKATACAVRRLINWQAQDASDDRTEIAV